MEIRTVTKQASIFLEAVEYKSEDLIPFIGKRVKAFIDESANSAFAVVHDMTGKYITNARNDDLWFEMIKDLDN